jgi:adenylylsulfate kinase
MCKIIWFTGLSGSGKSTLSNSLFRNLLKNRKKAFQVDGDTFRKNKNYKDNFSKETIIKNNINIIKQVNKIKDKYDFILVSVISPILKTRLLAKKKFKKDYFEIFVKCNLKTLKLRDTKGLYKKADLNHISNLIGYKSKIKYEKSNYKKITINSDKLTILSSTKKILKKII